MKGFLSNFTVLKVDSSQDHQNILFGGAYVWEFQPENVTGWGNERVKGYVLNPFTAPACKLSGLKRARKHACKQHIWWTYNNSTSSAVPFGRRPSMCSCEEGKKSLNDLESRTSIGRFSSDVSASTAVKGLNVLPPILEAQTQHCPKEPRFQ